MHPPLPDEWISKVLRVAMSESDWLRLEALVASHAGTAATQARANGLVLSHLLHSGPRAEPEPGPLDTLTTEQKNYLDSRETGT